jgi:seryl-tRNA synthetase
LLAERKAASKKIGELVSAGASVEEAKAQVDEVLARLASDLEAATAEADAVQAEIDALLMETPNLPDPQVPVGATEEDNVEVLKWGEPASFVFEPKDHVDLGEALAQMDFETAGKIAGARFSMLSVILRDFTVPSRSSCWIPIRRHTDIRRFMSPTSSMRRR